MYDVLKEMAKLHASKKKRYEEGDADILQRVSDQLITKETLKEKLTQHVEKVSFELYAAQVPKLVPTLPNPICFFYKILIFNVAYLHGIYKSTTSESCDSK